MLRKSFDAILSDLEATLEFCRSIGVPTDGSRFTEYNARLDHLIRVVRLRQLNIAVGRSVEEELDAKGLHYIVALTEGTELGDILPFLRTAEPDLIGPKLRDVLRGPELPTDEDGDSNQSRNILFELNLAARLHRAGFEPILGDHPDVACVVDGRELFFECKRPFSPDRVSRVMSRAAGQLESDIREHPGARGMVAVSLSKVMNVGDRLYAFDREEDGKHGLEDALTKVAQRLRLSEKRLGARKVVGIIYHVITPALNRELNMYYVAQQVDVRPLVSETSVHYHVVRALGHALEAVQY